MGKHKEASKPRTRHHRLKQLAARPVTFETCTGPVTIDAQLDGKQLVVRMVHPSDMPVQQPPSAA